MNIPPKDVQLHNIDGGMDSDTASDLMPPNRARYMLNVRNYTLGQKGVITNVKGNTLVATNLPSGLNIPMGWGADEENGVFYFIVFNDGGKHTVFMYTEITNSVTIVMQSRTDSNDIDIFTLNKDFLINHVDIIRSNTGHFITWTDGVNKAVKFNINKALDKSDDGYGAVVYKDYINAYKKTAVQAPTVAYTTDITRQSNFLYGKQFKFTQRFIFDDGEASNWSDLSLVALAPNQSYSGTNNITYENNCLIVLVETGSPIVDKIQVAMQTGKLSFVIVAILDKQDLGIGNNSGYEYKFYNDKAGLSTDQDKINRQYSYLPDRPYAQAYVKNAMTYTRFSEGFENISLDVSVSVAYENLFVPDGTVSSLNNPQLLFQLITNGYDGALVNRRYNAKWRFTVGFDVKKGNVFTYYGSDGTPPPKGYSFQFQVTAKAQDTAITIANTMIAQLRGIGRGYPNPTDCISDYSIDGSGNVSFNYQILGNVKRSPISWYGNVTPVNYTSLKDDGNSVNLIKPGSSRTYAFAYEDEDGRKSNGYTDGDCQIYTDFITQTGDLKRGVHTVTINHKPPAWAKYYYLLRTPDAAEWIQMLIQKVISVDPDPAQATIGNSQKYLDLVVGSLFTYQKLHPNTVIVYDFAKGDRLRLIKYYDPDDSTGTFYPFTETEILSYSINTEEVVNQNISLNGSDVVTITGPANPDYVGKSLIVNGYQRVIIGTPAGNQYQLNSTTGDGTLAQAVTFATFTIKDTRGILRIKKPDGVEVEDLSLVEIYKPVFLGADGTTQQFYPFGVKLEILGYGTATPYHAGTVQNQDIDSPAIITVTDGDAYERNRELPTNDSVPGTQLIVDHITDPNRSDFYESDLSNLGRVFPQDDGSGKKYFGSRTRWSNNFIEDTRINGLNDFDNLDRKDYNDPYGDIQLTKFKENRLFIFKFLKTGWASVLQSRIETADGNGLLATSKDLISDMNYYSWQGGIGNNPESWVSNGNYQYFASAPSGVFLRLAGDGCDPISTLYSYDKQSRAVLSAAANQGLRIFGGFDRENSEVIWAIPAYNNYIFKGGFISNQWNTVNNLVPAGTVFEIVQQPAHSTVSINGDGNFELETGTIYGSDYFIYRGQLLNGSYLPNRKECFTVVSPPNRPSVFRPREASKYCIVRNHGYHVRVNSKYCLRRDHGYRVRDSSKYCLVRNHGFRVRDSSKYCLLEESTPIIACGVTSTYSGGESFPTIQTITLGSGLGNVSLNFNSYSIPDKFEVWFEGVKVIDTGYRGDTSYQSALDADLASRGLPPETINSSTTGTLTFFKSTATPTAEVRVYAPLTGTAWDFILGCPDTTGLIMKSISWDNSKPSILQGDITLNIYDNTTGYLMATTSNPDTIDSGGYGDISYYMVDDAGTMTYTFINNNTSGNYADFELQTTGYAPPPHRAIAGGSYTFSDVPKLNIGVGILAT